MLDYVQPNYVYETQSVPNDPFYPGYQKVYPLGKVGAESAWDITTGSDSIIAAVLDTGANVASTNGHVAHPDLTSNLWSGQNNGEKHNFSENGHAITDVYDYEADQFSGGLSHGSNVASIIGAQGGNGLYMCGISRNVSLMILKVLPVPPNGSDLNGKTSVIVAAVNYAVAHGARVTNMSFGQYFCLHQHISDPGPPIEYECDSFGLDPALLTALEYARDNGVVAVAAAGNSGANNDSASPGPYGPANVPTDNLLSVAASDQSDARATFSAGSSNFGIKTVDLAAPGKAIWGLRQSFNGIGTDTNNYSLYEGTSQATPHVTGTIALLAAKYGWESYFGLRDRVLMGTDSLTDSSWTGHDVRTHGRLNTNKALYARTLIRNLSTRARVESNDRIMIGGFIIGGSGTGTLKIAIRGIGPSLTPLISVTALPNPKITLKNSSGSSITSNDDWVNMPSTQKSDFISAGLDKFNGVSISSVESGIVWTPAPGAYTVWLESNNGTSFGVGLFELYELENGADEQTRCLNVSTRCLVGTGDEQAIAGVIVGDPTQGGNTTIPKRSILMFGKGPSLGISGYLANPFLTLKNSAGTTMASNDSWGNLAKPLDELVEQNLDPSFSVEAALWPILASGAYTTILTGVSSGTGIGLVEMYEY